MFGTRWRKTTVSRPENSQPATKLSPTKTPLSLVRLVHETRQMRVSQTRNSSSQHCVGHRCGGRTLRMLLLLVTVDDVVAILMWHDGGGDGKVRAAVLRYGGDVGMSSQSSSVVVCNDLWSYSDRDRHSYMDQYMLRVRLYMKNVLRYHCFPAHDADGRRPQFERRCRSGNGTQDGNCEWKIERAKQNLQFVHIWICLFGKFIVQMWWYASEQTNVTVPSRTPSSKKESARAGTKHVWVEW